MFFPEQISNYITVMSCNFSSAPCKSDLFFSFFGQCDPFSRRFISLYSVYVKKNTKTTIIKLSQSNKLQMSKLSIIVTYLFPNQHGAFSVQRWFIIVIHIKLWKQHFILICRQSSLKQYKENSKGCMCGKWLILNKYKIHNSITFYIQYNELCEENTISNFKWLIKMCSFAAIN